MFDQHRSVPFEDNFANSFEPGQVLTICGAAHAEAERFNVNITSNERGPIDGGEISFHLSARFKERKFVLNHKDDKGWGEEERVSMPFKTGEHYDLHIRAFADRYEIWANRKKVHDFKHRLPLNTVRRYGIEGQTDLHHVHVGGGFESMPFRRSLDNFRRLDIQAVPKEDAERFNIDIKANDDVALTISVRFDEKAVVRNAMVGGSWGDEDRTGGFTLAERQIADITIVNDSSAFQLHINGQEQGRFVHRVQPYAINSVEINGDADLTMFASR